MAFGILPACWPERYVPIRDMPYSKTALLWRRRMSHPTARAFVAVARDVLESSATTRPG
jgi:hypothetical protein